MAITAASLREASANSPVSAAPLSAAASYCVFRGVLSEAGITLIDFATQWEVPGAVEGGVC